LKLERYDMDGKRQTVGISMGVAIALGAGIGAALGAATDNMALWVAVGIAIGTALGAAIGTGRAGQGTEEDEGSSPSTSLDGDATED
jgi:hypothetical protein